MNHYVLLALICLIIVTIITIFIHLRYKKKVKVHNQRQNEFMAFMIHELRSPLSVVRSSADMLMKEAMNLSEAQIGQMLAQIKDSASDLLGIVNNLLDVSKIEAGKVELFKADVNITTLLEEEGAYYKNLASRNTLELRLRLDRSIPVVKADVEKIKHIMNNLISNAIKNTEHGSITITSKGYKSYVQVTVADTGRGIPDELKKKLFSKFSQVQKEDHSKETEDEKQTSKGTGLGLVIVKGMVEAHNGRIWIEDNSPSGTKFNFTLPL